MEELIYKLKQEIIEVLNLEDMKPEDIDENASDSKTILYLEYFYKESLVDYYFDHSLDEKATADNLESYSISFNCDIVKLQFSGGSN